ncbi:MAG: VanZ family protein [Gammaproteobacteria bacterium]
MTQQQPRILKKYIVLRVLFLLGALTLVTILFWAGSQPQAVSLFPSPYDKIAHFFTFSILGLLLWLSAGEKCVTVCIVLGILIGILDEWHQASLPGRTPSIYDLSVDIFALLFIFATVTFYKKRRCRLK